MDFRIWVESWRTVGETISVPFEASGKNYLMKFLPLGLNNYFPYSPIAGTIYRVFWMPSEQAANPIEDEKYARTGGNTFSQVKTLLQTIEQLVQKLIIYKQPHGLTWVGNDPTLGAIWGRLARKLPQLGYYQSKEKPNVYLRKDIYDKAHEVNI